MLIFMDDYIVVVPTYNKTEFHKHSMLHIMISSESMSVITNDGVVEGKIILLDKDVRHKVILKTTNSLVLLIDPSTALADTIREKYLHHINFFKVDTDLEFLLDKENEAQIIRMTEHILDKLNISNAVGIIKEERIEEVVNGIKKGEFLFKTVPEIARAVALSESRLSHLFKSETGMRLKNCLLMYKLKYAYQAVLKGDNLTEAAMRMGFSDSAHLASVAKNTTGISISNFFNKE